MTEPGTIRVLIVDGHEGVRLGLSTALAAVDDLVVVGEARSGPEALSLCLQLQPDVVLMEVQLPDRDGIVTIEQVRRRYSQIQVVVLTNVATTVLRQHAESAGARAYLQKYVAVDELARVIRAVHAERRTGIHPDGEERPGWTNEGINQPSQGDPATNRPRS